MDKYHCCATCRHFRVTNLGQGKLRWECTRLGYETMPTYQFHCWDPKDMVKKKMASQEDR